MTTAVKGDDVVDLFSEAFGLQDTDIDGDDLFSDDAEEQVEDDGLDEDDRGFTIANTVDAAHALKKLRELQDIADKQKDIAASLKKEPEERIQQIDTWLQKELKGIEFRKTFYETILYNHIKETRETNPEYTVKTPDGTASTRQGAPKWEYDDDKLIAFLRDNGHGSYIKVSESVDRKGIKKTFGVKEVDGELVAVNDDGEVLEGVTITPVDETLFLSLSKKVA